mmetsp:Transcript_11094/g.26125  ORF Transcript_11094/g.26125 Transcript_11094/m.26125 type:complete len:238 (+) Transcript_11094:313-1026(+)
MYLRYSSIVVAPMQRSSPRARAGLSRLDASMLPSAAPAPTTVCISSMNSMISPAWSSTSLRTFLSRSSNSPRNLAPATSAPRSRPMRRLSLRLSGTSPASIRWAMPSAMAVLPTPGSPIRTGLFLVLRDRIWMARRISSSRPMTGSSLPSAARAVKSMPYLSSAVCVVSEMSCTSSGGSCPGVRPAGLAFRAVGICWCWPCWCWCCGEGAGLMTSCGWRWAIPLLLVRAVVEWGTKA